MVWATRIASVGWGGFSLLAVFALAVHWPAVAVGKQGGKTSAAEVQRAATAFRQGRLEEALRRYDSALQDRSIPNERRAAILTDRGVVRERAGRIGDAIADFNQAISLFPEYAVVYNNRGSLLVKAGAYDEALRDFDRALKLAPGYAAAHSNRAGALMKLDRYSDALGAYTKAIRLAPAIVEPLGGRAGALIALDRPRAAMRDLSRAIANDQRFSLGYRQRAGAHFSLGEYNEAAEDLSRAIAFDPSNAEFHLMRGRAFMLAKKPAEAKKDFTKVIELNPSLADGHRERGHAGILLEEFEQAEQDLARAVELAPRVPLSYAYRALMYKKLGQPELGEAEVGKALVLGENDALVHWAKGEIDEALSRTEQAIAAYRRALTIDPTLQNAIYGLKRLGEEVDDETEELPDLSFGAWRIQRTRERYFATNEEVRNLRVPIEMAGDGQPRIIEWHLRDGEFRHIGLLTFSAGRLQIDGAEVDSEYVAIIDTRRRKLVGIEPFRLGEKKSKLSWGSGRLVVAALDGLSQEFELRRQVAAPVAPRTQPARARQRYGGTPHWAPWADDSDRRRYRSSRRSRPRRRKPKTLFDLLLGN